MKGEELKAKLMSMALGDFISIRKNFDALRVPGGWIFYKADIACSINWDALGYKHENYIGSSAVFVPFTKEVDNA